MSRRLLIVTENDTLGVVLTDRFKEMGLQVLAAPRGQAPQKLAAWGRPSAVLWDLPPEHPAEAARDARALTAALNPAPALLLLAPPGVDLKHLGEAAAVLERPLEFEALADIVEHQIDEVLKSRDPQRPERSAIQFQAEVAPAGSPGKVREQKQTVRVRDLDAGGLRFESSVDYPEGTALLVWLTPGPGQPPLRLQVLVRWCRREETCAVVGCSYAPTPAADMKRLEQLLQPPA